MSKAILHDHQGAIADYTAAIDSPDAPPDVRAMALYNRAIVYVAVNNDSQAINDLRAALGMREAPANVRTEAKRKLVRMDRRSTE
jgi:hypothetical protein